ncbi:hypothetical protein ABRZ80_20570 [Vibrio vulnificus]|uniref:hypothetical protein n=1 Tax=Vibrio TaxID=662 RepID=UPI001EEAEF02|nr:hypothetical protein [Vibrio furnissii]MCG6268498.1 hypothetical protein [Vibrio furnissii]
MISKIQRYSHDLRSLRKIRDRLVDMGNNWEDLDGSNEQTLYDLADSIESKIKEWEEELAFEKEHGQELDS